LFQYFDEHNTGPHYFSATTGKHLLRCEKLQTVIFCNGKRSYENRLLVWDTDGIEDFNHNSSNLAAVISLFLVTVGYLTVLVPFKQCLTRR
jgi:hypothetical protein